IDRHGGLPARRGGRNTVNHTTAGAPEQPGSPSLAAPGFHGSPVIPQHVPIFIPDMVFGVRIHIIDLFRVPWKGRNGAEPLQTTRTNEQPGNLPIATRRTHRRLEALSHLLPSLLARARPLVSLLPRDATDPKAVDDARCLEIVGDAHAIHVIENSSVGRTASHDALVVLNIPPAALGLVQDDLLFDVGDK